MNLDRTLRNSTRINKVALFLYLGYFSMLCKVIDQTRRIISEKRPDSSAQIDSLISDVKDCQELQIVAQLWLSIGFMLMYYFFIYRDIANDYSCKIWETESVSTEEQQKKYIIEKQGISWLCFILTLTALSIPLSITTSMIHTFVEKAKQLDSPSFDSSPFVYYQTYNIITGAILVSYFVSLLVNSLYITFYVEKDPETRSLLGEHPSNSYSSNDETNIPLSKPQENTVIEVTDDEDCKSGDDGKGNIELSKLKSDEESSRLSLTR